jgi:hypothetical protein
MMSEFTPEELERAEFYFNDETNQVTTIVRGSGGDLMDVTRYNNKEYFKRKLAQESND